MSYFEELSYIGHNIYDEISFDCEFATKFIES